ncbi:MULTISPECIES: glutaminyl-peptide cyclotransferase [Corynebacterium]
MCSTEASPDHALNGAAHVFGTGWFLLGGKRWPDLYEVELIPAQ